MSVLELRCENALHGKLDPDGESLEIKCRQCTHKHGYPVMHIWPVAEIVERARRGELSGVCSPAEPRFVHWVVRPG